MCVWAMLTLEWATGVWQVLSETKSSEVGPAVVQRVELCEELGEPLPSTTGRRCSCTQANLLQKSSLYMLYFDVFI